MQNTIKLLLLAAGLVWLATACDFQAPVEADWAIENVHVISMNTGQIQRNRTVLTKGDRIIEIGLSNELAIAENAGRIDGNGGYLIPGLSEMHAHIPPASASRSYIEDILFLYLANGVTTIRGMLGDSLHLELREQAARDELVSPRIYTAGPGFGGNMFDSPEEARQRVREQYAMGYDFLKIFPGLTLEEYNAIADEADSLGMEFSGHVPASVGLERALQAGQGTIDHLDQYVAALASDSVDPLQFEDPGVIYFGMHLTPYAKDGDLAQIARMTRETGTWNVPTQALLEHVLGTDPPEDLAERPEFRYMPPQTVTEWINSKQSITGDNAYNEELALEYLQLRRDLIKTLHEEGAGLLLGSDAPQIFNVPGFSIHHELRYIVQAGLSPYEALRTGTYHAAQYFDELTHSGTVEAGKIADLVLLAANPLDDISNTGTIEGVMYRGNWLGKEEIEHRLETIAGKYR